MGRLAAALSNRTENLIADVRRDLDERMHKLAS